MIIAIHSNQPETNQVSRVVHVATVNNLYSGMHLCQFFFIFEQRQNELSVYPVDEPGNYDKAINVHN